MGNAAKGARRTICDIQFESNLSVKRNKVSRNVNAKRPLPAAVRSYVRTPCPILLLPLVFVPRLAFYDFIDQQSSLTLKYNLSDAKQPQ